jgi:hypothetical protein
MTAACTAVPLECHGIFAIGPLEMLFPVVIVHHVSFTPLFPNLFLCSCGVVEVEGKGGGGTT